MAKIIRSKMPVLGLALIIIAVPFSAFAGACFAHPIFIQDIEINSCAIMSAKNAGDVSSSIAPPSTVAKRYPGLILIGQVKAIRQIDQDEPGRSNFLFTLGSKLMKLKHFFIGTSQFSGVVLHSNQVAALNWLDMLIANAIQAQALMVTVLLRSKK